MCLTRLDFYPRSPCGERPNNLHISEKWARISIHALLAESDGDGFVYCDTDSVFLSTLSLRRATTSNVVIRESTYISIHALLAESDRGWCFISAFPQTFLSTLSLRRATLPLARPGPCLCDFYPRSPCGERRKINGCVSLYSTFLSTLSLRRATAPNRNPYLRNRNFYPRSPCGERPQLKPPIQTHRQISIHALLAESDHFSFYSQQWHLTFLSTLSLRRATIHQGQHT